MTPPDTSFSAVVTFIANSANLGDIEQLQAAYAARTATLRTQRARAIEVNQPVEIANITPAYLKGMTGTVESIDSSGRKKPRAKVRLDAKSTQTVRLYSSRVPVDATEYTVDVPLTCLMPQ
jgi:hypothetical protein